MGGVLVSSEMGNFLSPILAGCSQTKVRHCGLVSQLLGGGGLF